MMVDPFNDAGGWLGMCALIALSFVVVFVIYKLGGGE